MGSLSSRPKAPKQVTQVVYTSPATSSSSNSSTDSVEADPKEVAKERAESVLRRNRGVLGNVLTSFRGVLSQNNQGVARKTLLGE